MPWGHLLIKNHTLLFYFSPLFQQINFFFPQVYSGAHGRAMVFTPTKQEANELALSSALKQDCQVLHGDIPQRQREITLKVSRAQIVTSEASLLMSFGQPQSH